MPGSGENVPATFQPLPTHESLLNLPSRFRDRRLCSGRSGGRNGADRQKRRSYLLHRSGHERAPWFTVSHRLPAYIWNGPGNVQALIAGGPSALLHAVEGAEDSPENGNRDLMARSFSGRHLFIGLSASGLTPYVMGAVRFEMKRERSPSPSPATPGPRSAAWPSTPLRQMWGRKCWPVPPASKRAPRKK
jgi:hypothetical protein